MAHFPLLQVAGVSQHRLSLNAVFCTGGPVWVPASQRTGTNTRLSYEQCSYLHFTNEEAGARGSDLQKVTQWSWSSDLCPCVPKKKMLSSRSRVLKAGKACGEVVINTDGDSTYTRGMLPAPSSLIHTTALWVGTVISTHVTHLLKAELDPSL